MKSECLPFTQVPHTTKLFADFLSRSPAIQRFYPRSPYFHDWLKQETPNQRYNEHRRQQLSGILRRQNESWGASPKAVENIRRFGEGACVAVTGQQVGFFGGPTFSLFKALTAVKLAAEATAAGVDCVPIFWLATADHDLEEVNHAVVPTADGQLQTLTTSAQGLAGAPVGTIQFAGDVATLVDSAAALLGESSATTALRDSYRASETFGTAFARLFSRLFADWGVILLDGNDPELQAVAGPIYRSALERAEEIDEALLRRGIELEHDGYHQQVKVTPFSTLLFTLRYGARVPVHRRLNGNSEVEFVVGEQTVPRAEMLQQLSSAPEQFSPNVLLRPVVQDYLLPTLVYTGGAAEIAYFAQAAVVYEQLLGHVTPVLPRFSATLVEPKPQRLLERYELRVTDCFSAVNVLQEILGNRTLPADLQSAFDRARAAVESSVANIRPGLEKLDPTLVDAASRAASKMQYQLEHLQASAARAESRQSELIARHAEALANSLFPNKTLQEREIAGIYFVARYGVELLQRIYDNVHTDCLDHQIIQL